jgi:hypothetical protein
MLFQTFRRRWLEKAELFSPQKFFPLTGEVKMLKANEKLGNSRAHNHQPRSKYLKVEINFFFLSFGCLFLSFFFFFSPLMLF